MLILIKTTHKGAYQKSRDFLSMIKERANVTRTVVPTFYECSFDEIEKIIFFGRVKGVSQG